MKIGELPEAERKFVYALIRLHCTKSGLYHHAHQHGIGLEEVEQHVASLIDKGCLYIEYDEVHDTIGIKTKD